MKPINCNPKIKEINFTKNSSSLLSIETKNDTNKVISGIAKIKKYLTIIFSNKYIQIKNPKLKNLGLEF